MYYCICRQIIKTKNRLIYVIILPCLGTVLPVHRSSERMLPRDSNEEKSAARRKNCWSSCKNAGNSIHSFKGLASLLMLIRISGKWGRRY